VFAVGFWLNYQKKGDGLYSRRKQGAISAFELESIYKSGQYNWICGYY